MFQKQFDQMGELEVFFRDRCAWLTCHPELLFVSPHCRHQPHIAYDKVQMQTAHATKLSQPVKTRWGSQVDLAESVVQNRSVIQKAILLLGEEKFEFKGNELMFVWDLSWWTSIENLSTWLLPLRRYLILFYHASCFNIHRVINIVEADGITLGEAVEEVVKVLPGLILDLKKWAPGDVRYPRCCLVVCLFVCLFV
jgi:hypothetical protein